MYNKNTQRKIALIIVWALVIALVVTTFSFSVFAAEEQPGEDAVALAKESKSIEAQLNDMEEVLDHIDKMYVDEVDVDKLIDG
ncbi:MAG: hypothetical protein IKL72_01340, partial [Firmicutes bacterium]|nr:hypothetical protein [Bacillota bacterium]